MDPLTCPRCRSPHVRRVGRDGAVERLLSAAYIYPFRCQICELRFKRLRWGERYVRVELDRRDFSRVAANIWAAVVWQGRQSQATVRDLSVAGCWLETDAPVPIGELVRLSLEPEDEAPIEVEVGEVRSAGAGRLGIRFVRVDPVHRERLCQTVADLLAASPPAAPPA
ncbi:MAG: PilZ domain-containing protein [Candidatus Rokubacteria bacterium]|nr:PilZ domain-containing protein [Candidatus Rokubacteria bacterium]